MEQIWCSQLTRQFRAKRLGKGSGMRDYTRVWYMFLRFCWQYLRKTQYFIIISQFLYMWPSTGKPGTTRHPSGKKIVHLQSCRRPDIELSKFYRRSLSHSHYNRPNHSLPSAWNNTFLRNRSIFSRYLRTPRCARFSCRRSHIQN